MRVEAGKHKGWKVFLDGVEMRDVVLADDATGEVVRNKRDASGYLILDYSSGVRVAENETLSGTVILSRGCGLGSMARR